MIVIDSTLKKEKIYEFKFDGGLNEFIKFINENKNKLKIKAILTFQKTNLFEGDKQGVNISVQCRELCYSEDVYAYATIFIRKMGVPTF